MTLGQERTPLRPLHFLALDFNLLSCREPTSPLQPKAGALRTAPSQRAHLTERKRRLARQSCQAGASPRPRLTSVCTMAGLWVRSIFTVWKMSTTPSYRIRSSTMLSVMKTPVLPTPALWGEGQLRAGALGPPAPPA